MAAKYQAKGKPLSAAFVRSATEPGKYFDGGRTGLFLKIDPRGKKYWVQRIVFDGKRHELGLGRVVLVSLAEARETAIDNKRAVRAGRNPLAEARQTSAVLNFEAAARKVHELHTPSWRNKKHAADFIASLERYAFEKLGTMSVTAITTSDVLGVLSPIWLEKPETARRVRQRIGTVLKWAVAKGWRNDNPAQDIALALPKQNSAKVHRKALPYDKVAECLNQVRASDAMATTKLAMELLVLTASRSGEVRNMKWNEVSEAVWIVPAHRMKMGVEHRVPLSDQALVVLENARQYADASGLVFPGAKEGRPLSDMTLSKLIKELGFDAHVHGFRTSFRTWAQEQTSYPWEVAEAALAHALGDKTERAYARSDLFEKRRELMSDWSIYVNQIG